MRKGVQVSHQLASLVMTLGGLESQVVEEIVPMIRQDDFVARGVGLREVRVRRRKNIEMMASLKSQYAFEVACR